MTLEEWEEKRRMERLDLLRDVSKKTGMRLLLISSLTLTEVCVSQRAEGRCPKGYIKRGFNFERILFSGTKYECMEFLKSL